MFNNNRKTIPALAARTALAVALAAAPVAVAAPLKSGSGAISGLSTVVMQVMGKFAGRDYGINIQVNTGQTLTKTSLNVAGGKLDLTVTPPSAFAAMRAGKGPYANLGAQAKESAGNLRGLFGYLGGWFHAIVWADSGIQTYADLKGRKVFTGPPAGAANWMATGVIRAATGFEPGRDYESVRLNWDAGMQAMQDGQFDALMRPGPVGSASVAQLGAHRQFRLLSLRPDDLQSEGWKQYSENPWHMSGVIPAGSYDGQVNNGEDILTGAFTMQVSVNKNMDADTAYRLTKAFFDNVEEIKSTAATLKYLDESRPLVGMNIPLHPGALRYFREQGVAVPDNLIPPEAR